MKELRYLQEIGACRNYGDLTRSEKTSILIGINHTIAYASGVYGLNAVLKSTSIGLIVAFDSDVHKIGS